MQRYIIIRLLQSLLALWVMSLIVFGLARVTGDPIDALLPIEATLEERETIRRNWGLDRPLHIQYLVFLGKAVRGDFGNSWKWQGHTAMGLVHGPPAGNPGAGGRGHRHQHRAGAADRGAVGGEERHPCSIP